MAATRRRWRLAGLILTAVVLTAGCSVFDPFFVMMGSAPMQPPDFMKIASDDKDKEVKVVILAYNGVGVETRPEFVLVDHELTNHMARLLDQGCKENKEKVSIVSPHQVRNYKNQHAGWWEDLEEAGKHFDVDYVIYLEINSLSLYEDGSRNTLYRGKADITVKLLDMHKSGFDPIQRNVLVQYPNSSGPVPVEDVPMEMFRQNFLTYVAKKLSWCFTPHPTNKEIACE